MIGYTADTCTAPLTLVIWVPRRVCSLDECCNVITHTRKITGAGFGGVGHARCIVRWPSVGECLPCNVATAERRLYIYACLWCGLWLNAVRSSVSQETNKKTNRTLVIQCALELSIPSSHTDFRVIKPR